MQEIPADSLKIILELRAENGLEATEAAVYADLAKSKASWTLEETLRYRKAGRSPIYISGRYLTANGIDPATGEADSKAPAKPVKAHGARSESTFIGNGKAVDERAFYKVLYGKGFAIKISENLLTGELETDIPKSISNLNLQFGPAAANITDIHVVQTTPQIQVTLPLDKFLELSGIKA